MDTVVNGIWVQVHISMYFYISYIECPDRHFSRANEQKSGTQCINGQDADGGCMPVILSLIKFQPGTDFYVLTLYIHSEWDVNIFETTSHQKIVFDV